MKRLLARLTSFDAAVLAAVCAALFTALLLAAWVVSAVAGQFERDQAAAAVAAALVVGAGLLYAFRFGTQAASG